MTKADAEKLLLSLIEMNMAAGNFKKIEDLDKLREAVKVLADPQSAEA